MKEHLAKRIPGVPFELLARRGANIALIEARVANYANWAFNLFESFAGKFENTAAEIPSNTVVGLGFSQLLIQKALVKRFSTG